MENINDLIGKLLLHNNCVIIPSFGGFVTSINPAQINEQKGSITPPKKSLSFNRNLLNNDGLLINAYAHENNISFDLAEVEIKETIVGWKSILNNGERIIIGNVGQLYLNAGGQIAFEQDRFFNLLLSSFGLGACHFVPVIAKSEVAKVQKTEVETPTENTSSQLATLTSEQNTAKEKEPLAGKKTTVAPVVDLIPNTKRFTLQRLSKYAAVAALVPLAFYSFWIPMTTDVLQSKMLFKNDFNPFKQKVEEQYQRTESLNLSKEIFERDLILTELEKQLPDNVKTFSFPITEDVYIPVYRSTNNSNSEFTLSDEQLAESNTTVTAKATMSGFHLIAGCFASEENANSLINEMKNNGLTAFIVDYHKGLHRVSVHQSLSKKSAIEQKSKLAEKGLSTWVLKK